MVHLFTATLAKPTPMMPFILRKNVQLSIGVGRAEPCMVPEVFEIENQSAKN